MACPRCFDMSVTRSPEGPVAVPRGRPAPQVTWTCHSCKHSESRPAGGPGFVEWDRGWESEPEDD
jgi:hypothetical protein